MLFTSIITNQKRETPSLQTRLFTLGSIGLLSLLCICAASNLGQAESLRPQTRSKLSLLKKTRFAQPSCLWQKLRGAFYLFESKHIHQRPQVKRYVREYGQQKTSMQQMSLKARPYLYYIVQKIEEKGLPLELALLPMLESRFEPMGRSPKGAAGLWQFVSSTGKHFGLKQNALYDGRRDIQASTEAALRYLSQLHRQFNQDWMLALAAYNAGPGTVQRAIKRNRQLGKPTDFWSLSLPKETKAYVPKLIALTHLIKLSDEYQLELAQIRNKPYFKSLELQKAMDFTQLARRNAVPLKELERLNPGYKLKKIPSQGPRTVLIPLS